MEEKKRYRTICSKCGKAKDFMLEESRINRWKNGEFIQNVFPELNADDRERLITGICDSCWSKIFANVEDDNSSCGSCVNSGLEKLSYVAQRNTCEGYSNYEQVEVNK